MLRNLVVTIVIALVIYVVASAMLQTVVPECVGVIVKCVAGVILP